MWSSISREHGGNQIGNIILLGREAFYGLRSLGSVPTGGEIMTLNKLTNTSEDGSTEGTINIFRIREARASMVRQIAFKGNMVVIYALDWSETKQWPSRINTLTDIRQELDPEVKLVLTTTNHSKSIEHSRAGAAFNTSLDLCHQYMRTSALRLRAALVYSTDHEDAFDWEALLSYISGVPFTGREPPEEQYHGSTVTIYGDDSKQKILAVEPHFDFDSAYDNQLSIPSLTGSGETEQSPEKTSNSLPEELAATIKEFATTQRLPEASVSRAVLDGADDKKVISEFFSTIAQRSS